jgi:transcriptional regulator with XRE-family HTH domain
MQGWSQVELAQRAGLSSGTVKNLETKGQASLESFVHIVAALGLADDLGELFRSKWPPSPRWKKPNARRASERRAEPPNETAQCRLQWMGRAVADWRPRGRRPGHPV